MLSERLEKLNLREDQASNWTTYQLADEQLHTQLSGKRSQLNRFPDATHRRAARNAFDRYAYQWY
mgnify:FL=1